MEKRKLGNIEVSPIGMGCMAFSHGYGEVPTEQYGIEAFLFGAADVYSIDPHTDTWPVAANDLADVLRDAHHHVEHHHQNEAVGENDVSHTDSNTPKNTPI